MEEAKQQLARQTGPRMLRAAVIGSGYLGRFHALKYHKLEDVQLVAVVDSSAERAQQVGQELGVSFYTDWTPLLADVDLVSIATPTQSHAAIAERCLQAGVAVLLEKPMTTTVAEADRLLAVAKERGVLLQVGHLKRFHPAVVALQSGGLLREPRYLESFRLAPFKSRSLDLDVVLDLMIHDVNLALALLQSEVVRVDAVGMPIVTTQSDVANARLQFANGAVAQISASRVAAESVRQMRIFQENGFFTVDFARNQLSLMRRNTHPDNPVSAVESELLPITVYDTLEAQIRAFCHAVRSGEAAVVSGEEGRGSLQVVTWIRQAIAGSGSVIVADSGSV
ncbi:Gfo/Idh/MocA family protein [Candidatus Magnetaquicoccus inordinatus]|uniref:Gfo/Idh/MocA family protein n=1 Tax=Candidatus Magnetaquicoccus inordinatus TaxID=2496818 RepID=UPI00102C1D70|nr:Gfo/Idh/MocA family oxidoreductase [Candidatus Magnetaquicoccus inordinatus]